jgi:lambda family phage minor tail protein L
MLLLLNQNLTVVITVADSGVGTESIVTQVRTITIPDSGIGTENIILAGASGSLLLLLFGQNLAPATQIISVPDNGIGTEIVIIDTKKVVPDSGLGVEISAVAAKIAVADSGTGTETLLIQNYSQVPDSSIGTAIAQLWFSKNVPDSGAGVEGIKILSSTYSYITEEGNKLNPDTYLELFDFDATMLLDKNNVPGTISYYTNTPTGGGLLPLTWRGNNYYPLPFEMTGIDTRGDGTAPARPNISITNVNQFLLAAVLALGDLEGMKVTRWRTFYKFTDNGSQPNSAMYYPIDEWIVTKKAAQSKSGIQFEMGTSLDRPGLRLPRKLILTDQGFSGVSKVRLR